MDEPTFAQKPVKFGFRMDYTIEVDETTTEDQLVATVSADVRRIWRREAKNREQFLRGVAETDG